MFFIRAHPCHPWFNYLDSGTAGRHDKPGETWPEIFVME